MTLGPFLFLAPFALLGLIALPIIWWLLRATPPMPKEAELPSLRLLDGVEPREETPAQTPWWILLLRLAAAALAMVGLSQPIYAPGAETRTADQGALLIVIDDGWQSAPRFNELVDAARASLDTIDRDTPLHLLTTTPRDLPVDPGERASRQDMAQRLAGLEPLPWASDHGDALARLEASGVKPGRILWASAGMETGQTQAFADALVNLAPLTIYAAPPRSAFAITGLVADAKGALATLARATPASEATVYVSALSRDGTAIATAEASFDEGALTGGARFNVPPAALARADRFRITGAQGASAVWLWDSAARRQRVSLVSEGESAQPLLSDLHYVRRALTPFSLINEGTLGDVLEAEPDAIILTDIGQVPPSEAEALTAWVEAGGALIRFAGPRLAAQGDDLTPVPLRRASRALGGALAWDEPQKLSAFAQSSPFAGLVPPQDVTIRQQVLASPVPDIDRKTWARLEDGSPLVTAAPLGAGSLILFHITAGPDWSDLPYSGVFVEMLRRSIAAGQGQRIASGDGLYVPQLTLDGYGRLETPSDSAAPLRETEFAEVKLSQINPPGLYQGPAGTRALNVADNYTPNLITTWPAAATLLGDAQARTLPLAGLLLALALILIAIDLFVALGTAGRLPGLARAGTAMVLLGFASLITPHQLAEAQPQSQDAPKTAEDLAAEAALTLRFGYVITGDAETDKRAREGMTSLSLIVARRTSVTPETPHAIDLETSPLELYPLIYFGVPDTPRPLSSTAISRLNAYIRTGGALLIDTRNGSSLGVESDFSALKTLLEGLDAPALAPVPSDHVLTRSFYLLDSFQGRYADRRLWIEASTITPGTRRGDGVSGLFIGDGDYASAWAGDERGRQLYGVDGGNRAREFALRFGINLVMHVLTGNYKEDQVHLPILLERLGEAPPEDKSPQLIDDPASTDAEDNAPQQENPSFDELLDALRNGPPENSEPEE